VIQEIRVYGLNIEIIKKQQISQEMQYFLLEKNRKLQECSLT
ncbi:5579_t:CDS:1, partial [Racocetra fulgida]